MCGVQNMLYTLWSTGMRALYNPFPSSCTDYKDGNEIPAHAMMLIRVQLKKEA